MKRCVQYDWLRIAACFCVVLLHVSASYWSVVDVNGRDFLVMTAYNSVTRYAVPVFMMLSGALLLKPERDLSVKGSVRRALKMLLVFYLWSAFYAFQSLAVHALRGTATADMVSSAMQRFLFGHTHMWFLFLVIEFYLLIPLLSKICLREGSADPVAMGYFLALWIGFRFLLPFLGKVGFLGWLYSIFIRWDMFLVTGYMGYFVLGCYLCNRRLLRWQRYVIYAAGVAAWAYTFLMTVHVSRLAQEAREDHFSPGTLNVLLMAIAVFTFFQYWEIKDTGLDRMAGILSGRTLFIYMILRFLSKN